jgi:betaine reductase
VIAPRIVGAAFVLEHVPELVRYGSKPSRSKEQFASAARKARSYDDAVRYAPNQVFIGNLSPDALRDLPRPWWAHVDDADAVGQSGEIMRQARFYELLAALDLFDLVELGREPAVGPDDLPLFDDGELVGVVRGAHEEDESLSARVLLENLACKASGVHALDFLLKQKGLDPEGITYCIGAGEEAVGDRYQRGGGGVGRAIAEACGLGHAGGADVKAFCAGPIHALVTAGTLVATGVHRQVAVVAGGSLAKLGMKFLGSLQTDTPILEDVLAGMAILVGVGAPSDPVIRLDAVGVTSPRSGHSQQALLQELVGEPLRRLGKGFRDVGVYATELHNPEITEAAGGGDVPDRNYKMLAGLAAVNGDIGREAMGEFAAAHGLPGFSPTQGHIASAVPWVPHALKRFEEGTLERTMLLAKGSLFLGRLTKMWDGASIVLEARNAD